MRVTTVTPSSDAVPAEEHPLLLPHQRHALAAMFKLERGCASVPVDGDGRVRVSTRVGIYGDKAGSGKSYVLAELMLRGPAEPPAPTDVTRNLTRSLSVMFRSDFAPDGEVPTLSLLVVPHSLVAQWQKVLAHMSGDDPSAYLVASRAADNSAVSAALDACKRKDAGAIRLLCVSASLFCDAVSAIKARQMVVARVVYDEADSVRLQAGTASHDEERACFARFSWLVTASMHNLLTAVSVGHALRVEHSDGPVEHRYRLREQTCNSMFLRDMLRVWCNASEYLRCIVVVTDNAFVDASFGLEEPEVHVVRCTAPLHTRILAGIAPQEVIRRLNAGDIESAISALRPNRADTETNIIAAAIGHLNASLASAANEHEYATRRQYASREAADCARQRTLARVQGYERDIANVTMRIREATGCPICYGDISNKTVLPCCNNSFCLACITTWVAVEPTCPMCKSRTSPGRFLVCRDQPSARPERDQSSLYDAGGVVFDADADKRANLRALLRAISCAPDASSRKILFFSDNDYANDNVAEPAMREAGISFGALKGNAHCHNKRLRDFASDGETRALLINLTHYGCGLDLSRATDLILYHRVERRMDHQVVGRAQRPPRSQRLRVWRIVNSGEEEEAAASAV